MTFCNAFGALLFKSSMSRIKVFSIKDTFALPSLYLGILCYAAGSVLNILLLHYWDYSTIYPLTSLTCVWTLILSKWFLDEKINGYKLLGIGCIIAGAFLICI